MRITLAARSSDLARVQAYAVGESLQKAHPGLEIRYHFRESLGDINQKDPLWQMPERGVFTEDFYSGLVEGEWDLVVHSWKDLPVEERKETEIFCTMDRADQRDMLVMPKAALKKVRSGKKIRILSSSPRRKYNLEAFLKTALPFPGSELEFLPVRGNIPTRLRKLFSGEGEALLLAKAALDRLLTADKEEFQVTREEIRSRLDNSHWMILPLSQNPTAAAQGALAVEVARANSKIKKLLQDIQVVEVFQDVEQERKILAGHGGGCHQKIGVSIFPTELGRILSLRGETDQGERLEKFEYIQSQKLKTVAADKIFPQDHELSAFFDRSELPTPENPGTPLLVAKAEALPAAWKIPFSQIVWTAGIKTWQRLAKLGIWVNGTFDGLGEGEVSVSTLVGRKLEFTKLSHSRGEIGNAAKLLGTYELKEKKSPPDISQRTHFFWMSGSQFDVALRKFPSIANGKHFCGPGHTLRHIQKVLGAAAEVYPRLSYEEWKKEIL